MREFSHKLVTFSLIITEGGVSQAQLKRENDCLSKEIFDIDLRIQIFRSEGNTTHIPALEAAKVEIQKNIFITGNPCGMQKGTEQEQK